MDKVITIKENQEENILKKLFEVREEEIENIANIDKTTKNNLINK